MKKTKTKIDLLMVGLLGISAFAIMIGAFFKLEHWLFGDIIFKTGFFTSFLFGSIEIWRLRRTIAKLKEKLEVQG
ncbi:MAG: hypothetical protein HQ522_05295 [Bacteroidetes bacterium]|nr:hypothetical protein [Bacteroidota bacterium]